MAVSLVQSNSAPGPSGGSTAWAATFNTAVTTGNTLFLVVFSYDGGYAITASSPTYNGSSYASASQLIAECSTGGGNVFCAIWMFPNISGGGTTLGLTCTNGSVDGNVGWVCYEVSGLGSTPALDRSSGAYASTGNVSSGTTAATQHANEFIVGAAVGYAVDQTNASGFTNLLVGNGSTYCEAGYQTATSSGGTYTYATNTGITADWCAEVATIYGASSSGMSTSYLKFL